MAEPENHALRLIREFREEFREFRAEFSDSRVQTTTNFARVDERLETLTKALAGEILQGRYVTAAVDERLQAIEKRIAVLEERQ